MLFIISQYSVHIRNTTTICGTNQINISLNYPSSTHVSQHLSLLNKLSFCHKIKFSNPFIFATWRCKFLKSELFGQTQFIFHSLNYLMSTPFGCKDIGIRKSRLNSFASKHIPMITCSPSLVDLKNISFVDVYYSIHRSEHIEIINIGSRT